MKRVNGIVMGLGAVAVILTGVSLVRAQDKAQTDSFTALRTGILTGESKIEIGQGAKCNVRAFKDLNITRAPGKESASLGKDTIIEIVSDGKVVCRIHTDHCELETVKPAAPDKPATK